MIRLFISFIVFLVMNPMVGHSTANFRFEDISENELAYNQLISNLTEEAVEIATVSPVKPFILKVTDTHGNWIAGLGGYDFYGSFIIDTLWVKKEFRRKQIGSALLNCVEEHAVKNKLSMITVSTMEWWNALEFYQKQGFSVEFVRSGFENNYRQFNLKKMIGHAQTGYSTVS